MRADHGGTVRSVVVVTGEHSELALAQALLRPPTVAGEPMMLLPPHLHDVHAESFPGRAVRYTSLADIRSAVDAHDPQIVFLCSAYLFSLDKVLTPRQVAELLDFLRARHCTIATSDPLLGLARQLTLRDMDTRYLLPGERGWKRALAAAACRVLGSRKLLPVPPMDGVVHLYPTCAPDIGDGVPRLSYFTAPAVHGANTEAQEHGTHPSTPPRWLFALAEIDVHTQLVQMHLRDFVENILGMLRFAVAEGARPTLIAPSMIVDLLAGVATPEMELRRHLPVTEFRRRSLDAEFVFYWNAFSPSLLERLANELPIFVFDRGYLSRALKPYYEAAKACHFGGWEPKYLDQRQLFSPYVLAHLAKQQRPALRQLRQRWQASPSPDAVIRQLLGMADRSRAG